MSEQNKTFKSWKDAFERAARAALGDRVRGPDRESYHISVRVCRRHGAVCALVVYGVLLRHCRWQEEDPRPLAESMVGTMLPSTESVPTPEERTADTSPPAQLWSSPFASEAEA
jgi:hypothetical protein